MREEDPGGKGGGADGEGTGVKGRVGKWGEGGSRMREKDTVQEEGRRGRWRGTEWAGGEREGSWMREAIG